MNPHAFYKYSTLKCNIHFTIIPKAHQILLIYPLHYFVVFPKTPFQIRMGVFAYESENASVIAPTRLFKAFLLDSHNLIPKVVPQAIKNIEIISGNWGPGTVKKIQFGDGKSLLSSIYIY